MIGRPAFLPGLGTCMRTRASEAHQQMPADGPPFSIELRTQLVASSPSDGMEGIVDANLESRAVPKYSVSLFLSERMSRCVTPSKGGRAHPAGGHHTERT